MSPVNALGEKSGGVQLCTREYISALDAAGFICETLAFDLDSRWKTKFLNKIWPGHYPRQLPPDLTERIAESRKRHESKYIFLNIGVYPELAQALRSRFGRSVKIVLLSHGLESTDHYAGVKALTKRLTPVTRLQEAYRLGGKLMYEGRGRVNVDGALCLSPLDAELERWLGTRNSMWVPRVICEAPLEWHPVDHRVGCVATLDHPPNLDGLRKVLLALSEIRVHNLHFRIVGSPMGVGQMLEREFDCVDYLGPLNDQLLRSECQTWCLFVHPLFNFAKGCSTKLAVALGWGLPIATTLAGARGYCWDEAILPLASTPNELAQAVKQRCNISSFHDNQKETLEIVRLTPTIHEVAARIREFLLTLGSPPS